MEAERMPRELSPTQRCVVYDKQTGKVVHVHDFVAAEPGGSCDPAELRQAALTAAPRLKGRELAVADVPEKLLSEGASYRVDTESLKVAVSEHERDPLRRRAAD